MLLMTTSNETHKIVNLFAVILDAS